MKSALWLPLFDELADPLVVTRLAVLAEESGWDGFFVWDHINWHAPVRAVADPWITLSAIAVSTDRLRLGPMVCPPARRRPTKLARETATLDQLSSGRLTLGVGLGSDRFGGELSKTGEEMDDRIRGEILDETLTVLAAAWTGENVRFRGEHVVVEDLQFHPTPCQRPRVPIWVAGFPGMSKPMRRAARYDGYFPVNLQSVDQFAEAVSEVEQHRNLDPAGEFDYVIALAPEADIAGYEQAGATWYLTDFDPEHLSLETVRAVAAQGPVR